MGSEYRQQIGRTIATDVVVCGGGCAGFAAALACARLGVRTVLLEKTQMIGGTATAGLVGPFMTSFDGRGERQIVKGLFDEMVTRLEARGGAVHPGKTGDGSAYGCYYQGYTRRHNNVTPFRSDMLQLLLLDMLNEAGVELLINFTVIDVARNGEQVTGVIGHDGSELRQYAAKVVIDCTGDALVCYKANAVRPECLAPDYAVQPMTTFFSVYGVDDAQIDQYITEHPEERGMLFRHQIEQAMAAGEYPIPRNKIGMHKGINAGEWKMNCTRIQGLNPLDPADLTTAYWTGLRQIFFLMDFLKTLPGLANVQLKEIAPRLGIRESRRLDGAYSLETADLIEPPRVFTDTIALGSFLLDLHPSSGSRAGIDERPIVANCFQIPYRVLLPRTIDGLLAAGRCVSASRDALSSIRVMPQAFAMGEAAGTAAALCCRRNRQPRSLDTAELQAQLQAQGAVIA